MQTVTLRRIVLVLALGAAFLVPGGGMAAPAAQPSPPAVGAGGPGLLQGLWRWLATLWNKDGALIDPYGNRAGDRPVPLWEEDGAMIDPFGNRTSVPAPPPATDHQDDGAEIDPYGTR